MDLTISVDGVLLDIEGTTSSISFVHEVMFPFARRELGSYLHTHWDEPATQEACQQIARDAGHADLEAWLGGQSAAARQEVVAAEVRRLMDGDVKATGLKQLQGLIWQAGFESGELQAHLYDDVLPQLTRWRELGIHLRVYSSGSIQAQRLFFGHTVAGDLLAFFDGHYDTTTGPKKESASYRKIAEDFGLDAGRILFISDVVAELDAAGEAGYLTVLSDRPGNAPVASSHAHPTINTFAQLQLER